VESCLIINGVVEIVNSWRNLFFRLAWSDPPIPPVPPEFPEFPAFPTRALQEPFHYVMLRAGKISEVVFIDAVKANKLIWRLQWQHRNFLGMSSITWSGFTHILMVL